MTTLSNDVFVVMGILLLSLPSMICYGLVIGWRMVLLGFGVAVWFTGAIYLLSLGG